MKIFFWDFQDDNDIIRQWLLFTLNLLVLGFTIFALYRTWRYYRECMFEMMPLSINLVATFVLLNLKLFQKGYEFDEIGHFIEIFTYFLFGYTFAIMYTVISKPEKRKKMQRLWNIIMLILLCCLVVVCILVFTGIISKKCGEANEQIPAIVGLAIQAASFVPTGWYGLQILRKMMKKERSGPGLEQLGVFTSEVYIKQRKKQIVMVLSVYVISLVLRFFISMVTIFLWDTLFNCDQIDSVYILTSDTVSGQLVLIFSEVNQLLPHVVIPIAMYVVPLQRMRSTKEFTLQEGLIDDEEDEGSAEEDAHNRVSSLLTSRLSEGSPTRRVVNNGGNKYNFSDVVVSK